MPRLLVITHNQTLVVGLTLRGVWEVDTDPRGAEAPAAILIDDDGSDRLVNSLERARALQVGRVVVITDSDEVPGATVVHRPYRFDELLAALEVDQQHGEELPEQEVSLERPVETSTGGSGQRTRADFNVGLRRRRQRPARERTTTPAESSIDTPVVEVPALPSKPSEPAGPHEPDEGNVAAPDVAAAPPPPAPSPAVVAPAPPESAAPPLPPPASPSPPGGVASEVAHARRALEHVVTLLDRLPLLASLRGVAGALADEIVDLTGASTVAVYERDEGYFRIVASHGLSNAEERLTVSVTNELVVELGRTGGVLLVDGAGQSLLAGWAGSRFRSFLVVPAGLGDPPPVIVGAGGDDLDHRTLDLVAEAAANASSGLELALTLDLLARQINATP